MKQRDMRTGERGNVMFFIFLGIILFTALSFAVSKMLNQGGPTQISEERAKLGAEELIDYGRTVRQAVQQIRIANDCDEDEINFDTSLLTDYENTDAPSDNRCDVFAANGGGLTYVAPPTEWLDRTNSGESTYGLWFFLPLFVEDVGTAGGRELTLNLAFVSDLVCLKINERLDITNPSDAPPGDDANSWTKFTGDYLDSVTGDNASIDGITQIQGQKAGCYTHDSGYNIFYQVILAR